MKALSDTETSRTGSKCSLREKADDSYENVAAKPSTLVRNERDGTANSGSTISIKSALRSIRLLKESEDHFSFSQTYLQHPYGEILCDSISLYYPRMRFHKGETIEGCIVPKMGKKTKFTFLVQSLQADAAVANDQLDRLYEMNPHYPLLRDLNICYYGMPCAAREADSNRWRRARILKTTKRGKHCVLFVDTGVIGKVGHKKAKPLVARLANAAKPATIRCAIVGEIPSSILDNQPINLTVVQDGNVVRVKFTKKLGTEALLQERKAQ